MTPEKHGFFCASGYLYLERAVPSALIQPVRERIFGELERHGVRASGRGLPRAITDLPTFQQISKLSGLLEIPDLAAKVVPRDLVAVIETLAARKSLSHQSQLLLSPPNQGAWTLDGLSWHTDVSASSARIPGIQAFILLDDVEKCGGATLLLSGSHSLAGKREASSRVRDALRRGDAGVAMLREESLSVVELFGKAGDVYLMDMRVLHTPSINASKRFRSVATVRYFFE